MAKRVAIPFKEMQLRVVGPNGDFLASRIQRFEANATLPNTDVDELGNNLHAGTVAGTPEVNASFQAMDVSHKIFAALTGTDPTAYPASGVSTSLLGEIDLIGQVKDSKVSDYVKSMHAKRLRISGFTFTYSVTGEATEEYSAQGTEKRWFKNDVIVDKFTVGTNTFTLSQTPLTLKNGNQLLSVILDGEYLEEVASAPASGEYSVASTTLTTGDNMVSKAIVVYHASPAGSNWSYVRDTTIPAAVRGKNIPVTIGVNDIKRVQSVTIRGQFPTQKVEEMGNENVVGYTTQVPQVTGDISVLDTDLETLALLTTSNLSSTDTEFGIGEFTPSGLTLKLVVHDPVTVGKPAVKTIYIPQIAITSEGHSTSVGNNATQTFGFKSVDGSCTIYSGLMP